MKGHPPTQNHLQSLSPTEFEYFLAELWERKGWSTTVTQESTDAGVDVAAVKNTSDLQKTLIQAKRYNPDNPVTGPEVRQYAGLYSQEENVENVVVATTGNYTKQAREVGEKSNVTLIGPDELITEIKQHSKNHTTPQRKHWIAKHIPQSETAQGAIGIGMLLVIASIAFGITNLLQLEGFFGVVVTWALIIGLVVLLVMGLTYSIRHK